MLAEPLDVVIGVDTHKHTHTAADVSPTGAVLEQLTVPADAKGYRRLIAFGKPHDGRLWAIEGTGSFGAGLTADQLAHDERVVEVDRPERPARRAGAKSDDIDAVRAARQVLTGQGVSEPRNRGQREAIRVLLATRAQAIDSGPGPSRRCMGGPGRGGAEAAPRPYWRVHRGKDGRLVRWCSSW